MMSFVGSEVKLIEEMNQKSEKVEENIFENAFSNKSFSIVRQKH